MRVSGANAFRYRRTESAKNRDGGQSFELKIGLDVNYNAFGPVGDEKSAVSGGPDRWTCGRNAEMNSIQKERAFD